MCQLKVLITNTSIELHASLQAERLKIRNPSRRGNCGLHSFHPNPNGNDAGPKIFFAVLPLWSYIASLLSSVRVDGRRELSWWPLQTPERIRFLNIRVGWWGEESLESVGFAWKERIISVTFKVHLQYYHNQHVELLTKTGKAPPIYWRYIYFFASDFLNRCFSK